MTDHLVEGDSAAAWINVEISSNRVSGGGSVKVINGLIARELNASGKVAQQKVDKASELYDAFSGSPDPRMRQESLFLSVFRA